ncbi:hypothetical protein AAFC00_005097 [Neodothiora populina]|uniref:Carrier domain-containing protein n=1 Tax=Neodothiora populina TaxID=2781224 RepID=A0ABR3PJS3_9PEZI
MSAQHSVRNLVSVIDEVARTAPQKPWVYVPRHNEDVTKGYKTITFSQLQHSINKMARWIEATVGISGTRETLAFMDRTNDIRYIFAIGAALKTGYKILLTSTRNNLEGQRYLIQQTRCKTFLHGEESKGDVDALHDASTEFKSFQVPSLDELLEGDAHEYPGHHVSADPNVTSIIIHTSGSTGLPKPIELRNGWIATTYLLPAMQDPHGRKHLTQIYFGTQPSLCTLPFFHAMGLFSIIKSIFSQGPLILPPVGRSPNAEMNLQMIRTAKPEVGFFPPSILEDMVDMEGGLEALSTLQFILFAGAPLAHEVGDKIAKVARIQTIIGSTEAGILDSYVNEDPADWMYFEWCPWTGTRMEKQDELHELVLERGDLTLQGAFFSFPEIPEWRTKDLYSEHPTRKGLWQYRGRNDDVIVLSNGEKFNPIAMEKFIESHSMVKGALVVGQNHFQAGLLIETKEPVEPETFLDTIWPKIEHANTLVAAHGRIWKSKVAFVKEGKAFIRAPKGNIVRRKTIEAFADEIDALYSNEGFADKLGELTTESSLEDVKQYIKSALALTCPKVPADVDESADIFEFGVDSLQVLGLASALNHAIPKREGATDGGIKSRVVYANPSLKALSSAVYDVVSGADFNKPHVSREQRMADTIAKYTADLPAPVTYSPRPQKHAVVITGTTGSLGGYMLQYLLEAPDVAKVYALNRGEAESRQRKAFQERGVDADFSKVKFLQTSFDQERFGLSVEDYQELLENVDLFIHNAWAVNFNMDLDSFEPTHIAGTRRVIDFSASAQYHPHIVFISSIASTGCWSTTGHTGLVPEEFYADNSLPLPQGYGESKHVASSILAVAAEKSGIASTIVRSGQIGGPRTALGLWNRQEWLPSIVASSKAIGKIPRTLGNEDVVDWVPVDVAAQVLLEIAHERFRTQKDKKLDTFALVNPEIVSWSELVPAVQAYYEPRGVKLEVVEFKEWLDVLKSLPMTQEEVARVPGLKLLDFYEGLDTGSGLPRMQTHRTAEASPALKNAGPINAALIQNWCKQWHF